MATSAERGAMVRDAVLARARTAPHHEGPHVASDCELIFLRCPPEWRITRGGDLRHSSRVAALRSNRNSLVAWTIPRTVVEDRPLNVAITALIIVCFCHGVPIAPEPVAGE